MPMEVSNTANISTVIGNGNYSKSKTGNAQASVKSASPVVPDSPPPFSTELPWEKVDGPVNHSDMSSHSGSSRSGSVSSRSSGEYSSSSGSSGELSDSEDDIPKKPSEPPLPSTVAKEGDTIAVVVKPVSNPRVSPSRAPRPEPSRESPDSRKRKASPSPGLGRLTGLPRVSLDMKEKLLNASIHIELVDLLPNNTARGRSNGDDRPGDGGLNRKEPITSFALWARAYSVFMAYRTFEHPELVVPMLKYLDLIGLYADPKKGYKLEQWLDYDRYFRRFATAHADDPQIWASRHQETYDRCMADPRQKTKEAEICQRFNKGNCTTPCIRHRRHECLRCGSTTHGKYICGKLNQRK